MPSGQPPRHSQNVRRQHQHIQSRLYQRKRRHAEGKIIGDGDKLWEEGNGYWLVWPKETPHAPAIDALYLGLKQAIPPSLQLSTPD